MADKSDTVLHIHYADHGVVEGEHEFTVQSSVVDWGLAPVAEFDDEWTPGYVTWALARGRQSRWHRFTRRLRQTRRALLTIWAESEGEVKQ